MYSPVIHGLAIGQIVVDEHGRTGQLTRYLADTDQFELSLLDGAGTELVNSGTVRAASGLAGDFDVVVGPQTRQLVLGEESAHCLSERGFCLLKLTLGAKSFSGAYAEMLRSDADGTLGRLPVETEEGYLGSGGRARVRWMQGRCPSGAEQPSTEEDDSDRCLENADAVLSAVAEALQPFMEDALGSPIVERTPSLACLAMQGLEETDYENPAATNQETDEYYATWARGVLRVLLYLGPDTGSARLRLKRASALTDVDKLYDVSLAPGTLLVLREDTFECSMDIPDSGKAVWLQSFFLRPGPQFVLEGSLEGDTGLLDSLSAGPPPPSDPKALVAVVALGIQSALKISNHHQEWAAYTAGTDGQLEMPFSRFDYTPYYSDEYDNPQNTTYVKHFSVQEGVDLFDNRAFEISNAEGEAMDPMFRQIMEVGYCAVLQLGITKKFANTNPMHASVSVGCDKQEWLQMPVPRSSATNNQLAVCANRFNYVFNLKGGSYVCDTACSSTLVAGHLGKMNLLETRWDPLEWHLAMGCSLTLTVGSFLGSCASHMVSPQGRCFSFNATANGYNRGDGTSSLLMKLGPNEDKRLAYLRGTQIGQDGRSASMSAPNGPAQEKCTWGAMREARMTPPESTTWDAHGTGTALGDPIEIGAVRKVQIKMKRFEPLLIATSKSNFGHLEGSAAGIAMNKCVMVVVKTVCAPTSHLNVLNPHLDHASFDAVFATEHVAYRYKQGHCQVSSFGVGGTNGHAIFWGRKIEEHEVDYARIFLRRLLSSPPPLIQDGSDPADWAFRGLSYDAQPGDKYKVVFSKDDLTGEEKFSYEKEDEALVLPEFYCTTGSHNDWGEDRMLEGDVANLFYQEVTIPDGGELEFRILAEDDHDKVIAPSETTSKYTAPVLGPQADLRTSWLVKGDPGKLLRIELLAPPKGPCGVLWLKVKDDD